MSSRQLWLYQVRPRQHPTSLQVPSHDEPGSVPEVLALASGVAGRGRDPQSATAPGGARCTARWAAGHQAFSLAARCTACAKRTLVFFAAGARAARDGAARAGPAAAADGRRRRVARVFRGVAAHFAVRAPRAGLRGDRETPGRVSIILRAAVLPPVALAAACSSGIRCGRACRVLRSLVAAGGSRARQAARHTI